MSTAADDKQQPNEENGPLPYHTAAEALEALIELRPGLRWCANRAKGKAWERAWQDAVRPTAKHEWPTAWQQAAEFCLVPSTAGAFLVDMDAAFDEGADGEWVERKPTQAEARELAAALGGHGVLYESTKNKGSWHALYADTANGGRDWGKGQPQAVKGASRAGFASQGGLLWQASTGAWIKFDTRGGGVYPPGSAKAGKVCGARMDADFRRLCKLIRAIKEDELRPIENTELLGAAYAARHTAKAKSVAGARAVHDECLKRTNEAARMPPDMREQLRAAFIEFAVTTRKARSDAPPEADIREQAEGEWDRALEGAIADAEAQADYYDDEHAPVVGGDVASHFTFAGEFVERAAGDWLQDDDEKQWWRWDGEQRRWSEQTHDARSVMRRIIHCQTCDDDTAAKKWQQSHHLTGALAVASDTLHCSIAKDFNAEPMLAGLPNGMTLDLHTGKVREATRDDRVTAALGVAPKAGQTPHFDAFTAFAFGAYEDDAETLTEAVLWFLGDALRGHCNSYDSHRFLFFQGDTRTGKSTISNIIRRLLGTYAVDINATRLVGTREEHLQWMMRCRGKRLVHVAEVPNKPLKCEVVNTLSAGDSIEANDMKRRSEDWRSSAHLVMHSNHKPRIDSPGTFQRMALIEMNRKPEKLDAKLEDRIVEQEGAALLQRAIDVRGALAVPEWPDQVAKSVREYEMENDLVGQWLAEKCEVAAAQCVTTADAFDNFKRWCEAANYRAPTKTHLTREMKKKGYRVEEVWDPVEKVKPKHYMGVRIAGF